MSLLLNLQSLAKLTRPIGSDGDVFVTEEFALENIQPIYRYQRHPTNLLSRYSSKLYLCLYISKTKQLSNFFHFRILTCCPQVAP